MTTGDAAKVLARPYRFQCPPMDSFALPFNSSFQSYTNYKGTEFLGKGADQLMVLAFRTLIVEYGTFVVEAHWERGRPDRITGDLVAELVSQLRRLRKAKRPFRLLATHAYGDRPEIDITAVLESLTVTETSGEEDTRYLDLSFKQWRDPVVSQRGRGRGSSAHTWPKYLELDKGGRVWGAVGIDVPSSVAQATDANDWTFALLAKYAYGRPSLASHIMAAQKPPLRGWGAHSKIMSHHRYKKGGRIKVPAPPPKVQLPTGVGNATVGVTWDSGMPGE